MKLGLGIDTGGTYTDAVLYDFDASAVLDRAKAPTTKERLLTGITAALDRLDAGLLSRVGLAALSTTLATNACVEGRGRRAGLILIGCDPEVVRKYGAEYGLPAPSEILFAEGGHDLRGARVGEPDWARLEREASGSGAEAFAVVELWGIANPEYEKEAGRRLRELTGKPVVCGHEITNAVNSLRRAASALLNAQLVGVIGEFLDAVHAALRARGLKIPVTIVRSDGTMMSDDYARTHPVETLLCGPAASVCGGMFLTGRPDCVVADMGGTTTDIAVVRGGEPLMTSAGASIGGWKTGIRSLDVTTVGLGGDSLVRHDEYFRLSVGPTRAIPLCGAAVYWPQIKEEIERIRRAGRKHTVSLCEFFRLLRQPEENGDYATGERAVCAALEQAGIPLSVEQLAQRCGMTVYEVVRCAERSERYGILGRIALTPTDVMHAEGVFTAFDSEAARAGAEIMALQVGMTAAELCAAVRHRAERGIYSCVVRKLLALDQPEAFADGTDRQTDAVIEAAFDKSLTGASGAVVPKFVCPYPLVGLGAPIHVYLPAVARALDCECIVDADAGVANAIGAVTGNVAVRESVTVTAEFSTMGIVAYHCAGSGGAECFSRYEDAIAWAEAQALEAAHRTAEAQGAVGIDVRLEHRERRFSVAPRLLDDSTGVSAPQKNTRPDEEEDTLLETVVTAIGHGRMDW